MWCVPSAGRCVRFTGCCAEGSFGLGYQWFKRRHTMDLPFSKHQTIALMTMSTLRMGQDNLQILP